MTIGLNFNNFEPEYKAIVTKAVECMEDVIYDPIFLLMLKDEISKSNDMEGELSHWKEALPVQIYSQLFPITLYLNTYYTVRSVIGYGTESSNQIYINTKYLSNYSIEIMEDLMKIGSNLLHEHSHDCGFDHDFKSTARRPNSISYIMNRAYERAFKKFYNIAEPEAVIIYYNPWYKKLWRKLWN